MKTKSITAFTGTCVEVRTPVQTRHHGSCLARRGWTFQQGKELDIDRYQGSTLPAERIDVICDDPLQSEEADGDDIELVSLCDSVQEKACREDAVQEKTVNKADQSAQLRLAVLADFRVELLAVV